MGRPHSSKNLKSDHVGPPVKPNGKGSEKGRLAKHHLGRSAE